MLRRQGFSKGGKFFDKLVQEAVDSLPEEIRRQLENVAVMVEEEPPADWEEETGEGGELLGTYQGISKKDRGFWYGNVLPDCIMIYRGPLERMSTTAEELKENVRQTVVHEVGHYFGLDEEDLRNLEDQE